jgi:peptidoglycan/xylan/chitin deacetylase (PgdA/CDA1 family)
VSVDLDELHLYHGIFGLPAPAQDLRPVHRVALPRLLDEVSRWQIPVTLFVVGAELGDVSTAAHLRRAARVGHEVSNHTLSHRYDLARCSRAVVLEEVAEGARRIAEAVGAEPVGFRAPGYAQSRVITDVLEELQVRYDASALPSIPYHLAKAVVWWTQRLRGRRSSAVPDVGSAWMGPRCPRWHNRVLELPMTVGPVGIPFIGTTVANVGPRWSRRFSRALAGRRFVQLELHGVDFLDVSDGLRTLEGCQPGVAIPSAEKMRAMRAAVVELRQLGYQCVRLCDVTELW